MNASQFDPALFLDATLDQPTEKRPPLPVECPGVSDGLYTAIIGEIAARAWQGKKDPTKSGIAWDVPLLIEVPQQLQEALKLQPQLTLRDSIMVDLNEQGMIDNSPGKNRRLRIYREATDLNKPGDVFSARKMQSKVIKVKLSHELYEGQPVERIDNVLRG